MGIFRTISVRVLYAAALLLAVLVLNFSLMHLAPGDVADTISQSMGGADQEILDEIRVSYGLDQPFIVQYFYYIAGIFRLDFGISFSGQPVIDILARTFPVTLRLAVMAVVIAFVLAIVIGLFSALGKGGMQTKIKAARLAQAHKAQ